MKTTPQSQITGDQAWTSVSRAAVKATELFSRFARAVQLKLVASAYGRIVLHALVALKTGHYVWHFQGIAREFVRQ